MRGYRQESRYLSLVILLCLAYLGLEWLFNTYTMISVDEFWFAHRSYAYKDSLPYRDFAPYKTVIGYYLLLLPMLSAQGVMGTLIFTKQIIALINAALFLVTAAWLTRFTARSAILASLGLLLLTPLVLNYSTDIRVDLFAYWLCTFSLLCLLGKRYWLAGMLIGLGFCTSQKATWYLLASNVALLISAPNRRTLWQLCHFNAAALLVIASYLGIWSWIANWHSVSTSVFTEAAAMYQLDTYTSLRKLFWTITLSNNPLLFLLWPCTLISLSSKHDTQYKNRLFVIVYASTILCCLIANKQIFPYYMQATIPIFLVLYAFFFNWVITTGRSYLIVTAILLSSTYSLALFITKFTTHNNTYQKANIEILNTLLATNDQYIAGIDLIYNKSQAITGLRHLMSPAILYLYQPTPSLRQVMLPALDEDPNVTAAAIMQDILNKPVKYYVNNYRMMALPPNIRHALDQQFTHLWGSIYSYAPKIARGINKIDLKFDGTYRIQASQSGRISLNGHTYATDTTIALHHGFYQSNANFIYRLKLIPRITLDARFSNDHWEKITL